MVYTAADLEVLVLSHKRPAFLRETLSCYRAQTVQGFRLAVYSNGKCPEIKDISQQFNAELFYEEQELGMYINIQRAIAGAKAKLTILAHDDDLIAPGYVEALLRVFNKYENLTLAISQTGNYVDSHTKFNKSECIYCSSPMYLGAYIFTGGNFTFSSFCAKTAALKKVDISKNTPYGKVTDVPFMFQTLTEHSVSCVLIGPFIMYRLHNGQDCVDYATGPTAEQWLNLARFYKQLFIKGSVRFRIFFMLQNFRYVRIGWRDWCKCEYGKKTYLQYLALAYKKGVISIISCIFGVLIRGSFSHYLQQKLIKFHKKIY